MAFFKSLNFNNKNLKAKKNTFKNIILNEKMVFIFTINILGSEGMMKIVLVTTVMGAKWT